MINIFEISLSEAFDLTFKINKWFIVIFIIIAFLIFLRLRMTNRYFKNNFEIEGAEIGIKNSIIKFKPNFKNRQIAYKLWVELNTRKIGLAIDFNKDIITEIYSSWYEFFKITRELLKEVPIQVISKDKDTVKIIEVSTSVLNECLRPHLTSWQGKFLRWYNAELTKEKNLILTPQEIQKNYYYYTELESDMRLVNEKLKRFNDMIKELAFGKI